MARTPVRAELVNGNGNHPVRATLVNGNGNGHGSVPSTVVDGDDTPVRATLVPPRNEDGSVPSEPLQRAYLDDEDIGGFDDAFDDEPDDRHIPEGHVVSGGEAPWSPVPLNQAREYVRDHPDAALEVIFPTVYDEDRSKKLQDLSVAETAGAITHQRMAEQMAKELGFDNYNYEEELRAIEIEHATLPPFILAGAPETTGLVGSRPATGQPSQIVGKSGAAPAPAADASAPMMSGALGFGVMPPMPTMPTPPVASTAVHREPVSGDAKAEFRRSQKTVERQLRKLRRAVREAALVGVTSQALLEALGQSEVHVTPTVTISPPVVNMAPAVVNVPEPVVNVAPAVVNVAPAVVNVPEPVVNVTVEREVKPPQRLRRLLVERDAKGLVKSVREVRPKRPKRTPVENDPNSE